MIPTWYLPGTHLVPTKYHSKKIKQKKPVRVSYQVTSSGQDIPEITGPQLLASGVVISGMPQP
jgi:hypothetical protein